MKRYLALALCVLMMTTSAVHAADGDLDITFGTGGKVTTDFSLFSFLLSSKSNDEASAVALQPNGKIVVAGYSRKTSPFFDSDFALARYNSDGSLDNTFGAGGKITTDFSTIEDTARALGIQLDGKIVVAGTASLKLALARHNSDGSLDPTFGLGGKVTTDLVHGIITALGLQSDGKIIVAAEGTSDFALVRYNSDGSLDSTFGLGGKVATDFSGRIDGAKALSIQSDGKILVAGYSSYFIPENDYVSDFALARYNVDGSLDLTFGTGGKVITTNDDGAGFTDDSAANGLALQSDGKIVAAGGSYWANGPSGLIKLARYNRDGSLDPTFAIGGKVTVNNDVSSSDILTGTSLALQADGKIVVGAIPEDRFAVSLVRYNSSGSLDTTFGTGGYVSGDGAQALGVQFDGKIVTAGRSGGPCFNSPTSNCDFALNRYNNGLPIMRFDSANVPPGGSFTTTFSGANLTDETYFDVRFRSPDSADDNVALNWQRGMSAAHGLPADTITGSWRITGVRPHRDASDHSTAFVSVSATLTVLRNTPR